MTSWPQNAYVGQKVVCIKTWYLSLGRGRGDEIGPIRGNLYTIRKIGYGLNLAYPNKIQIHLMEIINPQLNYTCGLFESAFDISRFRPVQSTDTGMEVLHSILNNPTKVLEDV